MKTKNIFKTLALAMLMPTMLLTTACSSEDDFTNNTVNSQSVAQKGYALPVTVNVSRQGDEGTTRAAYNESTRTLSFSTGDKLFVEGIDNSVGGAGRFAGTLTWQSGGTFTGTIYTQEQWPSTADALFTAASASGIVNATLLPNGYESYNFLSIYNNGSDDLYDDVVAWSMLKAFVASETAKATGVEQLSWEKASTYSSGFALAPRHAILNFTISGFEAGAQDVTLSIDYGGTEYPVTGSVTPNASGVATFAIGVPVGSNIKDMDNNLTVGTHNFTLPSSTTFAAGKIYNISRNAIPGALIGQFSVSSTKKVYFSKGNLQATYDGSNWTWAFAANQWDYIGNAAGNTKVTASSPYISENATVDLFGWVGASSTWTGVNKYGITSSSATNGYGNVASESLKSDWGALIGLGWRTLSMAEWTYLLATRTVNGGKGAGKSYTLNQSVNGKTGMVIYPDNYTGAVYSGDNWASFEAAGCVFLPAAGWRDGTTIKNSINDRGYYWSTTPSNATAAKRMFFAGGLELNGDNSRAFGFSVRLVREVE